MKILIFSHTAFLGGAERSMLDLLKVLTILHDIHVILPSNGPIEKELHKSHILYSIINYSWWAHGSKTSLPEYSNSFNNILNSTKFIQKLQPDLIITNTAVIPWGAITARILNIPHIWNIREFVKKDHQLIPEIGFKGLAQFIYEYSDKIFFVSESVKNEYEKYIPKNKSSVIYSQINIDQNLVNQKINSPFSFKDSFKILLPASIAPNKDQKTAIKAVQHLILNKHNIELLIMGLQNKNSIYFQEIQAHTSNRIHLLNYQENPYPYFKLSNVVLVCSKNEALSRTIIEAGLLKVPIIVSNRSGNVELITHKKNGLVYKFGNYLDLAKQILTYLQNQRLALSNSEYNYEITNIKFSKNKIYEKDIPEIISKIKPKTKINNIANFYSLLTTDHIKVIKENETLKDEMKKIKNSFLFKLWPSYNQLKKILIK